MTEVEQMRADQEELKKVVDIADATDRLLQNEDFKKVFLEYFMVEQCARNAQMSCDLNLKELERQACLELAQAAGHVQRFINMVLRRGDSAQQTIRDIDEEISLILKQVED